MWRSKWLTVLLLAFCSGDGLEAPHNRRLQEAQKPLHDKAYWKSIVKNHYAIPSGAAALPLARELNGYLGSTDPELRDDLAYSILSTWIAEQKTLSTEELLTFLPEWQANLRDGIGETGTDNVFKRAFSVICLAALAERDLKEPFLGHDRFRALLENALNYLREERDLRGFDAKKGWMHATAHTADLLAELARSPLFGKQDQGRVLEALRQRLASANEIFTYGEQDRLANAAASIVARTDFDGQLWRSWVADVDKQDQAVFNETPPKLQTLQRFENDTYFLQAVFAEIALRPATASSMEAQKTVLAVLRARSGT